jgi:hypothetical protein
MWLLGIKGQTFVKAGIFSTPLQAVLFRILVDIITVIKCFCGGGRRSLIERNKQKHDDHNFTMFEAIHARLIITHSLLYETFVEKEENAALGREKYCFTVNGEPLLPETCTLLCDTSGEPLLPGTCILYCDIIQTAIFNKN